MKWSRGGGQWSPLRLMVCIVECECGNRCPGSSVVRVVVGGPFPSHEPQPNPSPTPYSLFPLRYLLRRDVHAGGVYVVDQFADGASLICTLREARLPKLSLFLWSLGLPDSHL